MSHPDKLEPADRELPPDDLVPTDRERDLYDKHIAFANAVEEWAKKDQSLRDLLSRAKIQMESAQQSLQQSLPDFVRDLRKMSPEERLEEEQELDEGFTSM